MQLKNKIKGIRQEYVSALCSGTGGIILSFLLGILSARILSVEDRGAVQYIIVQLTILSSVLSLGVPFSNSYFEAKGKTCVQDRLFLIPYLVLVLIFFLFLSWSNITIEKSAIILFSLCFSCFYYVGERLKNPRRLHLYSRIIVLQPLFCLFFLLMTLQFRNDVEIFIFAYCFSYISSISFLFIWNNEGLFNKKTISADTPHINYRYIFGYWSTLISSVIVSNIDKVFIAVVMSKFELGVYAVVQTTSSVISRLSERVAVTYFVIAAGEGVREIRFAVLKFVTIFVFPVITLGWLVGKYIIPFVFSEKYAGYSIQTSLLFLSVLIGSAAWILAQQANSSGRPHLNMVRNLLSCAIFMLLAGSEVFGVGLTAVSIAVVCSGVFRFSYSYIFAV